MQTSDIFKTVIDRKKYYMTKLDDSNILVLKSCVFLSISLFEKYGPHLSSPSKIFFTIELFFCIKLYSFVLKKENYENLYNKTIRLIITFTSFYNFLAEPKPSGS